MAGFIKIFQNNLLFKVRTYLTYYLKFGVIGTFLGFVVTSIWDSLLSISLLGSLVKLNDVLLLEYKNILSVSLKWPEFLFVVIVSASLLIIIKKGYQFILKGSLLLWGIGIWTLLNGYNFWKYPFIYEAWTKPVSLLTLLFNFAILFILLDIVLLLGRWLLDFLKSLFLNLKIKTKIGKKKINIDIESSLEKFKSRKKEKNDNTVEFSDEPLKDISEIFLIRKIAGNDNLFVNFLKLLDNVSNLLNREDNEKNYTRSICLDGPWGSGKTSLINILREKIKNAEDCKITWIDFSPWNFNNSTEFIKDFFDTLNKELLTKYRLDLQPNLRLYVDLVTPIIESTGFFGNLRSILLEMPFFAPSNLIDLKESLDKKLASIPEKIVIVLDDIDRLKLEEIEIVLQLVRQLSNFRNVLFILPFDYDRISALITKQKGETYSDFLGKIVNSRIRLSGHSYIELEAIFMTSVSHNLTSDLKKELEKVFDVYVRERTKSRFEEIRERESVSNSSDPTLKPMVGFARDVFKILYPNIHYMGKYVESVAAMNKTKDLYLGEYYPDTQSLVNGVIENFSVIKKQELLQEFNPLRQQIDVDINTFSPTQDQKNEIDGFWVGFADSLKNGQPYQTIEREWNSFKAYALVDRLIQNSLPSKSAVDQIDNGLKKYKDEFDDSTELQEKIRNWFIISTTPRQVKDLARAITDEVGVSDIVTFVGVAEDIAIRVSNMQ